MTDGTTYLTPEGFQKLTEELQQLKTVRRREIADQIERAKELGDLSENAEYHEAKDEQAFIEGRILELEAAVNTATVIAAPRNAKLVTIGSAVQVRTNGDERTFAIVGASEADPLHGRISNESPIGRALLGRSVGDVIAVDTPNGKREYAVLKIS